MNEEKAQAGGGAVEREVERLLAKVRLLRQREPTQAEADAVANGADECFVDGRTARRCIGCRRWTFGGPTRCIPCAEASEQEGYPGIACDFEAAKMDAKLARDESFALRADLLSASECISEAKSVIGCLLTWHDEMHEDMAALDDVVKHALEWENKHAANWLRAQDDKP